MNNSLKSKSDLNQTKEKISNLRQKVESSKEVCGVYYDLINANLSIAEQYVDKAFEVELECLSNVNERLEESKQILRKIKEMQKWRTI